MICFSSAVNVLVSKCSLFLLQCLKLNIPEGRQQDLKEYDQFDPEVDCDVFEEIVKQSPGTFWVSLSREEAGWDSDMSAILLLLHLLPPSAQGRKKPIMMSASQAVDHLIRFLKTGTSVQQHLDQIMKRTQPYLLAQGYG
ncbi:hypothetical protein CHARACLAT_031951 [Characodon lateralis]|uniref:Uncharacterized protein n=1 Tax=Characodon lateralis TaxID=208331 RepID=A0ABU7EIJ8_9TELE|nr:hypothetical protein [Characodon lateralis]